MEKKYRTERWICEQCGENAPCIVEIQYEPTVYPHVEEEPRFRSQSCLCNEGVPMWSLKTELPDKQILPTESKATGLKNRPCNCGGECHGR